MASRRRRQHSVPVAIDCEMVGTGPKGVKSALGRVSIVDYYGNILYDTYCLPDDEITDYRTKWSGIRPVDIENAPKFGLVRKEVIDLIRGRVLIGHAIKNDFTALDYNHPWHLVRDTERSPWVKEAAGIETKHVSLKVLSKLLLNEHIQGGEHSSVVDALCTMGIYKVVEKQWEADLIAKKQNRQRAPRNSNNNSTECKRKRTLERVEPIPEAKPPTTSNDVTTCNQHAELKQDSEISCAIL